MQRMLLLLLVLSLTAAPVQAREPVASANAGFMAPAKETNTGDHCTAYQGLVGKGRRDVSGIEPDIRARNLDLRVYTEGDALIQNYSSHRVNVELDRAGRIACVWCG